MSSDDAYASFLDQANQDTTKANASSKSKDQASTKAVGSGLSPPSALKSLDVTYTSDADEPFEPVILKWSGKGKIDSDSFLDAIGHSGKAEEMTPKDFDPHGQYSKVIDAVKAEGSGSVQVFRVEVGGARAQYYVVVPDGKGHIVGARAKAVES